MVGDVDQRTIHIHTLVVQPEKLPLQDDLLCLVLDGPFCLVGELDLAKGASAVSVCMAGSLVALLPDPRLRND